MKTRLTILSCLLLLVFGFHVGYSVFHGFNYAQRKMTGYEQDSFVEKNSSSLIKLNTHNPIVIDSVFDVKQDVWTPVQSKTATVSIPVEYSMPEILCNLIFVLVSLVSLPILIIYLYKVINSVLATIIFDKKNIARLRIIGFSFLALWLVINMRSLIMSWELSALLKNTNYSIERGGLENLSFLVYALISLLIAEILAMGLRLKEEQDLTI